MVHQLCRLLVENQAPCASPVSSNLSALHYIEALLGSKFRLGRQASVTAMSQFYPSQTWSTGWAGSTDPVVAWQTYGGQSQAWATNWDDVVAHNVRTAWKPETHQEAPQTRSQPTSVPKPIAPPAPVSSQGWVHVTSAETWTSATEAQQQYYAPEAQTSPSKTSAALGSPEKTVTSPANVTPPSLTKRHHDIEDEIGHQDRYKTELCRSWQESGTCRYGAKCQFAHGAQELRPIVRHPKYKTEICRSWAETKTCPYGRRCRFIHDVAPKHASFASAASVQAQPLVNGPSSAANSMPLQDRYPQEVPMQPRAMPHPQASVAMYAPNAQPLSPHDYSSSRVMAPNMNGGYPIVQGQMQYSHAGPQYVPTASTSPPYGGVPYGNMHVYNSSPPLSPSVRAANAPWMNDVFQDDEDDDDFLTLQFTPLIEQLNLHAEPVSPGHSAHRPAPIGPSPIGTPARNNGAATVNSTTAAQPAPAGAAPLATSASSAESDKGKKKKGSRLGIFQRLSSSK